MKTIRTITFQLVRTYSRVESAGIRNKVKLLTTDRNSKIKHEDFGVDDPEIYELDFMNADKSNVMRDREKEKSEKLLPYRIVKSKYFKEVEPSFLTYAEKDQIKKLHNSDPEEWTPDKLSQSFPALPHIIKKVLKSNWQPKSVDVIIKYDSKVIENWKNFKSDKLAVNPALKEHLMKFRNRKISLPDRESLERFVPRQTVLPKPKCNIFTSIIQEKIDEEQHICNEQLVSSEKIERNLITDGKKTVVKIGMEEGNNCNQLVPSRRVSSENGERLVFTDFMKKKLNDSDETSPEEKETLLSTYRKHIETINFEDVSNTVSNNDTKNINNEKDIVHNKQDLSKNNALTVQSKNQSEIATKSHVEYKGLETYVKERNSLMDTNFDYIKRIQIPKNTFKKGMTYRIKDCYYDDDGEFLYRTPGLKT